jgi:hypothetical protein
MFQIAVDLTAGSKVIVRQSVWASLLEGGLEGLPAFREQTVFVEHPAQRDEFVSGENTDRGLFRNSGKAESELLRNGPVDTFTDRHQRIVEEEKQCRIGPGPIKEFQQIGDEPVGITKPIS